ncbi:hypothetical protein [Niallia nealsonii]|nr:hypothetical protein [Niallia nealsonii]
MIYEVKDRNKPDYKLIAEALIELDIRLKATEIIEEKELPSNNQDKGRL